MGTYPESAYRSVAHALAIRENIHPPRPASRQASAPSARRPYRENRRTQLRGKSRTSTASIRARHQGDPNWASGCALPSLSPAGHSQSPHPSGGSCEQPRLPGLCFAGPSRVLGVQRLVHAKVTPLTHRLEVQEIPAERAAAAEVSRREHHASAGLHESGCRSVRLHTAPMPDDAPARRMVSVQAALPGAFALPARADEPDEARHESPVTRVAAHESSHARASSQSSHSHSSPI